MGPPKEVKWNYEKLALLDVSYQCLLQLHSLCNLLTFESKPAAAHPKGVRKIVKEKNSSHGLFCYLWAGERLWLFYFTDKRNPISRRSESLRLIGTEGERKREMKALSCRFQKKNPNRRAQIYSKPTYQKNLYLQTW